jgi:hypothetical protein
MNNGDTHKLFNVGTQTIRGVGSFHKTLPHNDFGEVDSAAFDKLVAATAGDGSGFATVPKGVLDTDPINAAALTNPQAGLAHDRLVSHPSAHSMRPAPTVLSVSTAAEMTELYWMALLRDKSFDTFESDPDVVAAAAEISAKYQMAQADGSDDGHLQAGVDLPGAFEKFAGITPANLFRLGLPGEDVGPLVSQFFVRSIHFGTQTIGQMQLPYVKGTDYLTDLKSWIFAQRSGKDMDNQAYPQANEHSDKNFELNARYISTPRDLARFVNKDALHQAYFNAALILLSGGAKWTPGNPYSDTGHLHDREAGFGVLGGPQILALVSEVASRALKVVWNQKWQVHLRLRPEAYGGLVHVQEIGIGGTDGKRAYGLPGWVSATKAASMVKSAYGTLLLPMAYTPGSPTHPSYGAGHATVAGACVTVLKAYFETLDAVGKPLRFTGDRPDGKPVLTEREKPYGPSKKIQAYSTGVSSQSGGDIGTRTDLPASVSDNLTIEGELNKLAMNVAMGRSVGGVHWRSDNARSLMLGEALAARILADISIDCNERPEFLFRTFSRRADGEPKTVRISEGRVFVDDVMVDTNSSAL